MNNENLPEVPSTSENEPITSAEPQESFGALLSKFEQSHKAEGGAKQLEGTVVSLDAESVFLDIGFKVEGLLPRTAFANNADDVKRGDTFPVSVKGRNEERYYVLSLTKVSQPKDWASLEEAFTQKSAI